MFDLGWSVEKFGRFDRTVNMYSWTRDAQKSERIGKKYQWIAYHEFLGLVSDNFEFDDGFGGRKFEGPWQLFARDIDPSCVLRSLPEERMLDEHLCWWSPQSVYKWRTEKRDSKWVTSTRDLPPVEPFIRVTNPEDGSEWLSLVQHPDWKEPVPPSEEPYEKRRRSLWYQIKSYLVAKKDAAKLYLWLSKQHFWGQWMPTPNGYHRVFLGEFYWAPVFSGHEAIVDPHAEGTRVPLSNMPSPLILTSDVYSSELNSFDCSNENRFNLYIPGSWIVEKMGLHWNGREGRFFDAVGDLVAFDPAVSWAGPNALLVRRDKFLTFLEQAGYEIIWTVLGAKQMQGGHWGRNDWEGELQISGVFKIRSGEFRGKLRPKVIKR